MGHILAGRAPLCSSGSEKTGENRGLPTLAAELSPEDAVAYPTAQDAMSAWDESVPLLTAAMESASAEAMAAAATEWCHRARTEK